MALTIRDNLLGRGVYTSAVIPKGTTVLEFQGPVVPLEQLPPNIGNLQDYFLQIGPTEFLGPSGDVDDFVNHSCDPNCGVFLRQGKVLLVAVRDIPEGDEISFDYSTTMSDDDWELPCGCQSARCRGTIAEFIRLSAESQCAYLEAGMVPNYVKSTQRVDGAEGEKSQKSAA